MASCHQQRGGQYLRHASWALRSRSAGHRQDLPTTRAVLAGLAGLAAGPIVMLAAVGGTASSAGWRQRMRLLHRTRRRHVEHARATPQGQHGTQQTQQKALQRAHDAACMPQVVARVQRRGTARLRRPRSSSRHSTSPGGRSWRSLPSRLPRSPPVCSAATSSRNPSLVPAGTECPDAGAGASGWVRFKTGAVASKAT